MDTCGNVNIQYVFTDRIVLEVHVFKNVLTNIDDRTNVLKQTCVCGCLCLCVRTCVGSIVHCMAQDSSTGRDLIRDALSLPMTDRVKTQEAWIFTSLLSHWRRQKKLIPLFCRKQDLAVRLKVKLASFYIVIYEMVKAKIEFKYGYLHNIVPYSNTNHRFHNKMFNIKCTNWLTIDYCYFFI